MMYDHHGKKIEISKGDILVTEGGALVACLENGQNVLGAGNFVEESRVESRNAESYTSTFP